MRYKPSEKIKRLISEYWKSPRMYDYCISKLSNEFKHDLFNNVLKKFTVDAYYLKLFKKIFKKASIKTLGTLSGRTTSITLHDNDNSLLLMTISE